ncbi:kinesin-like protein KIN-14I [Pollicipes pollicipes]|uniref:kinesin-like protein KIN-14I n=1 Tax=Pollicipes pollicipes TaxID=41117 RepID=UPI001884CA23|nr:kinesin-like protein KIN-14I [Pollicipes pollicipes]
MDVRSIYKRSAAQKLKKTRSPELLESLYSQVSHLDSVLTSLEGQIQVLEAVQKSLPQDLIGDAQHDSGTAGHEPDSLEAMRTVLTDEQTRPGSGHSVELEPAVLLHLERCAHRKTRRQLQLLQNGVSSLDTPKRQQVASELESLHIESEHSLNSLETLASLASSDRLLDELKLREMTISQLRSRVLQLERARLDKIPMDPAREITRLQSSVVQLERVRDELTLQNFTLKSKLAEFTQQLSNSGVPFSLDSQPPTNGVGKHDTLDASSLTTNISSGSLDDGGDPQNSGNHRPNGVDHKSTYKIGTESGELRKLRFTVTELRSRDAEQRQRISELETQQRNRRNHDDQLRALEARLEETRSRQEVTERDLSAKKEEYTTLKLDFDRVKEENGRLKDDLSRMMMQEMENSSKLMRLGDCESELGRLLDDHRTLSESLHHERLLRKKYYNMMEELKGRIRVFCRLRPLNEMERRRGGAAAINCADEFTLCVDGDKGQREFQFDKVFTDDTSQERIFEEVESLIQSSLDGYNVCICAYGQTGSGKTYTLLGDERQPGVVPRAFQRLFQLTEARSGQFSYAVSAYMLELYNDRLLDLLAPPGSRPGDKLEVKKDKRGLVHVQGATVTACQDAAQLQRLFQQAVSTRHTAATRLNVASSRSHLVIGVTVEATSRVNGTVFSGKLSLLDLAGSERVAKSGATADQLKEANAINRSLSALADVISSLAAEQSFIPYRNSKLTMLMQDSLGGNAKTLMFVNISPGIYNIDETMVSLMYASRVKQITNSAARNAENKEITRLKNIIAKLKQKCETAQSCGEEFDS